jgi:PST family polysaccharide transporter
LAWLIALAQGLTPTWYFQGVERLPSFTMIELGGRVLMTAAIFATVRRPADSWQVLAWQALFSTVACAVNTKRLYKEVEFVAPRARGAWDALRMSWGLFLFRATVSLYTTANVIILNVFVSSAQIALYGGSERLAKALLGILGAVPQAVFPRISHLVRADRDAARRLARISAAVTIGASILLCLGLILAAPLVIRLVLGAEYEGAVPLLRILALLVPIITMSGVLGVQWMLPLGMDRPFMRIVAIAGVLNVALGAFLSAQFGAFGMSCAVVGSELFVTVAMFFVVAGSGHVFWKVERSV